MPEERTDEMQALIAAMDDYMNRCQHYGPVDQLRDAWAKLREAALVATSPARSSENAMTMDEMADEGYRLRAENERLMRARSSVSEPPPLVAELQQFLKDYAAGRYPNPDSVEDAITLLGATDCQSPCASYPKCNGCIAAVSESPVSPERQKP